MRTLEGRGHLAGLTIVAHLKWACRVVALVSSCGFPLVALTAPPQEGDGKYPCGARQVEAMALPQYEDRLVRVRISDGTGKQIFPTLEWPGTFISLCSHGAYLLVDTSSHHAPGKSFLMSPEGSVIASYEFGEVAEARASDDQKLFWVQSMRGVENPTTLLRAYDFRGMQIISRTYGRAAQLSFEYDGKTYVVSILKPELPG